LILLEAAGLLTTSVPGSGGPIETPIVAEQAKGYIVAQLKMDASGD
jgi:hypothetical protein